MRRRARSITSLLEACCAYLQVIGTLCTSASYDTELSVAPLPTSTAGVVEYVASYAELLSALSKNASTLYLMDDIDFQLDDTLMVCTLFVRCSSD